MCHWCIPGFGPSLYSVKFQCTDCTKNAWLGTFFYLLVELVPITVFYLLILAFRIHITSESAPMTCFIAYSQIQQVYNRADEKSNYVVSVNNAQISQAPCEKLSQTAEEVPNQQLIAPVVSLPKYGTYN